MRGAVAKAYKIYRCWVSEYRALPERCKRAHAIAIEHMVLQNEGWERDVAVSGTEANVRVVELAYSRLNSQLPRPVRNASGLSRLSLVLRLSLGGVTALT